MHRFSLLALVTFASAALAQDVGTVVPEMRWKQRYNWGDMQVEKLSDLRGSAVLLEFFTTGENLCIAQVPRLCALHENEFKNGLVVIGVTGDAEFAVKLYLSDHSPTYPIGIGGGDGFDVEIVPHSILIDPDGVVVWNGPSAELEPAMLTAAMAEARPATYAAGLGDVARHMAAEHYGAAWCRCRELLDGGQLADDARAQAEKLCRLVETDAAAALAVGERAFAADELFEAVSAWEAAVARFGGLPGTAEATARVEALRGDKRQLREIEGGAAFAAAHGLEEQRAYDDAYDAYMDVRRRFGGTKAAKKADGLARAIKKDGKLGFMRACGACEAIDRACDLHKKRRR